jgi:hypothetical protein
MDGWMGGLFNHMIKLSAYTAEVKDINVLDSRRSYGVNI